MNKITKVIETKNIKDSIIKTKKVIFKNNTKVWHILYEKNIEYEIPENIVEKVRNFII